MAKTKLDPKKLYVDWCDMDYGMTLYMCRSREQSAPVGLVWGLRSAVDGKKPGKADQCVFAVYGSFVPTCFRRQGVRRLINQKILKHNNAITSASATREGEAFMKASGYKRDRINGWVLTRK